MVSLALGVLIVGGIGEAQSRLLSAARVHVSVQMEQNDLFVYRYTVENGAGSTAGISRMTIDVSLPLGASTPSNIGLTHGAGYFAESAAGKSPKAGATIPVGLSAPQPGWRTTCRLGCDGTLGGVRPRKLRLAAAATRWIFDCESRPACPEAIYSCSLYRSGNSARHGTRG